MIQAVWSLRTTSHRSRQTGIAEGISFFLPYMQAHSHSLCLSTDTLFFPLFPVLSNAHRDKHTYFLCFASTHPPAHTSCLSWHQSAFPPHCWCDRGAVRASQSQALMLSQSDRAAGGNAPNKQPVILPCPFTYSSLSNQSADRVGKSTDILKHAHTQAICTHTPSIHTAVCIIIGSFQRSFLADVHWVISNSFCHKAPLAKCKDSWMPKLYPSHSVCDFAVITPLWAVLSYLHSFRWGLCPRALIVSHAWLALMCLGS